MTVESERGTSATGVDRKSTPAPLDTPDNSIGAQNRATDGDKSPELLRYRADSLLDEMMLGAVDVSAADNGGGERPNSKAADAGYDRAPASNGSEPGSNGADSRWFANGTYSSTQDEAERSETPAYAAADMGTNSYYDNSNSAHAPARAADELSRRQNGLATEESAPQPTPEWRVKTGGGTSEGGEGTWNDYVSSFRSPTASSGQIQKWQPDSPADGYTARSGGEAHSAGSADTSRADEGYRAEQSQTDGDESGPASESGGGYGYVSAMAVMPRGPRRSSLLPRMSRFDVDSLNREIAELHEEIRALLPVGHDHAERARHLLDKAHSIAASDPERSAEVEYYMQQVRAIVERTRQSRRWSNLYRDRLHIYLLAWTLLSTMTLAALLLSQFQIEAYVAGVTGAARNAMFMRNFAGGLGSVMAGALGGALGALLNMRRHARSQYGFFDRKYGLRGLMLPIIGAIVGFVIYAVFATVYYLAGINPSLSAVAMALPAVLAFVFGFSQESLYGTRS